MEEFVGLKWHRYISQRANRHYPEARVELSSVKLRVGIFFRALGGESGLRVEKSLETNNGARRSMLQRIAGTGRKNEFAWRDQETLRLPPDISIFPSRLLNESLYYWLAAIAAFEPEGHGWLMINQERTVATLKRWPGLTSVYKLLVHAHIQERPIPESLPPNEAAQERVIQQSLLFPELRSYFTTVTKYSPQPVLLWLHPSPPDLYHTEYKPGSDGNKHSESADGSKKQSKQKNRKAADRAELPKGNGGLMSFRLESLWSWSEYVKVDRSTVEDDDDDVMRTVEDVDGISLTQDGETTKSKIKLDLDLPSSDYDDIRLGSGIPIDEWDYKHQIMRHGYCRLQVMQSRSVTPVEIPPNLRSQVYKVRRQFELLRPQRQWQNRQLEGAEIDMENYVNLHVDRKTGHITDESRIYRSARKMHRDLSCLLLADLSLSTDTYISNSARVIDVIRDSLYLFAEALNKTGDRFALHGFSSRSRNHVRFYNIKQFNDPYNANCRGFIHAIKPGYYTRMGAAIRYASELLLKESSTQKILLILTDGKPNDLDKYEGRYGVEDTRAAILEAQRKGLQPFCVTIDEQADEYIPYLFGRKSYVLIRNAAELPKKLPQLYMKLTSGS